ncbi:MAG: chemotaxis protein CheW [Cyanobacteria bacterium P01_G01_bin.67]
MSNLTVDSSLNTSINNSSVVKLIVFEIGRLTLALPILQIQKIVKQNKVHGSGLSHVNLAHLAEQEVAIVDLHQKLFGTVLPQTEETGYFIISQNINREPLGIFVAQAPNLIDVVEEQIRVLPDSYRRADTLEIASHVAIIPQGDTSLTIFILDISRLA